MFNVGSGEFLIILLVALVVLGPTRLPGAIRQVGQFLGEARKLSSNFQNEVQEAMNDPVKVVTGVDTPKLPKTGKELLGFAVPEPFASQKADPKETDDAASDASDSTSAASEADTDTDTASDVASVVEPAELPTKQTGPTFHSAGPATPVVVDAEAPDDDVVEEPAVVEPPADTDAGPNDGDDEVPMFGDR